MPYTCKAVGEKYHLTKRGSDKAFGTHDSQADCMKQMRALYANETTRPQNITFDGMILQPFNFDEKVANAGNEITLVINSQGGDFLDSITMHNKIRNSGKKVTAYINPFAISAAAVLALAADEIYMVENGVMKFHAPIARQDGYKDAAEYEKVAAGLRVAEDMLVKTMASKIKKTEEECRAIMNSDAYYTADQALAAGIIDGIIPIYRDPGSISNLGFPAQIMNFLEEKKDMPLQELCAKFGVADETALETLIANLQKNQVKAPPVVTPALVNMVKQSREKDLEYLVTDGSCTPDTVNALKLEFLNDDSMKSDCIKDDPNSQFNKIIGAIKKNPKVLNFNPKTGRQEPINDPPADDEESEENLDPKKNPLIANMVDRKKQWDEQNKLMGVQ